MGFGATLTHVLVLLDYCDRRGLVPAIRTSNRLYRREGRRPKDWFGDYFVNLSRVSASGRCFSTRKCSATRITRGCSPTASTSPALTPFSINTSPYPSEAIGIADAFAHTNFRGRALGVHYRGTNKFSEAPRVAWESSKRRCAKRSPPIRRSRPCSSLRTKRNFCAGLQRQGFGRRTAQLRLPGGRDGRQSDSLA